MNEMAVFVALIIAVVLLIIVIRVVAEKRRQQRASAISELAGQHGWQFIEEDDSYVGRWRGRPFAGTRGRSRHIVLGEHRGRQFCAFAYRYTTSTGKSSQTHHFTIWAIGLPDFAPDFSVGEEGVFGGKVAEAFGFARVDIDDEDFNNRFKVKCDDPDFGRRVLDPAVIEVLKRTGPWAWRLTENSMLSFENDVFEAERLIPRLELMCDVLDRIPADVWEPGSHAPDPR